MDIAITLGALLAQMGVVGLLFRWQHVQIRDNKRRVDKMYSKSEVKEMIDIKLKPIEVGIAHVQEELKEVKAMIGQLLHAKNNKD